MKSGHFICFTLLLFLQSSMRIFIRSCSVNCYKSVLTVISIHIFFLLAQKALRNWDKLPYRLYFYAP